MFKKSLRTHLFQLILSSLLILGFGVFTGCTHQPKAFKTPIRPYSDQRLEFYSTKNPYGEFSNFALYPVYVDEQWWMTSEHYYQAQKYTDPKLQEWVRSAPTPMEAALRGRESSKPKRPDWNQIKDQAMEKAVRDKFTRYTELQNLLLSTGTASLFEHTKNDCYWGDCGDGTGLNKLGLLLEKIRAELRSSTKKHP